MRRSLGALLLLWLAPAHSFPSDVPHPSVHDLSACSMLCWVQSHTVSHCALTDVKCQCETDATITYVSNCVVDNCSLSDALEVSHFWAQACHRPHNNKYSQMRAAAIGSGVAAFLMVACRIVSRLYTVRQFWWDDWFHIISGVISVPLVTFSNLCVVDGMGYHLYDINFPSLDSARDLFLWYYLAEIFYCLVIYFIKMSILFLYIRIFPETKSHRYFIATMVFVTVAIIILLPMVIWQCVPINAIWDLNRNNARCLSVPGVAYANAAVNIATEIAILVLPIPLLRRLRVSTSKKIALYALFGAGILVIAIASARLPSLTNVEAVEDPTYLNQKVFYWSCAETSVAHVCATALAIRPLYLKLHAKFIEWKKRKNSTSSTSGTDGARNGSTSKPGNETRSAMASHQVECLSQSAPFSIDRASLSSSSEHPETNEEP